MHLNAHIGSIKHYYHYMVYKAYRSIDATKVSRNRFGVKSINPPITQEYLSMASDRSSEELYLDPSSLHFAVDGLVDRWTQVNLKTPDTLHSEFIQYLGTGPQKFKHEYQVRSSNGNLDGRKGISLSTKAYLNKFQLTKEEIESDSYPEILVSKIKDKYYIIDGKHRASMALMLSKKIRCRCIDHYFFDSHFFKIYTLMKKEPSVYSKHISFYKSIFT